MRLTKNNKQFAANTKYRVCSLHFESDMFSNFQKNRLKPEAVPTLFDTMEVECVDDSKNNDEPECSTSNFMPLSCSTPGMSCRIYYYKYNKLSYILGCLNNLFRR